MLKALFRDSMIYTLPSVLSRGVSILLVPIYARALTPAVYGAFDLLLAIAGLAFLIVPLEISQGSARYFADAKNDASRTTCFSSSFLFTSLAYILFASMAVANAEWIADAIFSDVSLVDAVRLVVLYIVLTGLFYLTQNQLRWELQSVHYAAASVLMTLVGAGASVMAVSALDMGVNGLLIGMSLGSGCGLGYGLWFLRHRVALTIDRSILRSMLSFSVPLVPAGIVIWLGAYADRVLLNYFMTLDDVGLYGMAQRVASIVGLVMVGIQVSLTPLIYSRYRDQTTPAHLAKIFEMFVAFALVIFLLLSMFSRELITLFASERYAGGASVVIFLVPATVLAQMYIFAPGPGIAKKTSAHLWISLVGTSAALIGGLILVPLFGLSGAAMATLSGSAVAFVAAMWISQRLYPVPHRWNALLKATTTVGLLAAGLAIFKIDGLALWGARACALLLSLWLIFAVGLVRVADMRNGYSMLCASWLRRRGGVDQE